MSDDVRRRSEMYLWMLVCRTLERACAAINPRWFPCDGEEAAIVGAFYGLRPDDVVAPHYRGPFVVYLMRGAQLSRLVGQALGKVNGYTKGRSVPFSGPVSLNVVPWVAADLGTSLSVATGAALSFRYHRDGGSSDERVAVVSFGDGTANRGDFHEAVNLAAVWKLPIVFVCQNNGWAISEPLATYVSTPTIADRARGYGIPGHIVDGNDPIAVNDAVQAAVRRAREGDGPTLVEARTYRLAGHWAEDVASYRSEQDVRAWQAREPIAATERLLIAQGVSHDELVAIENGVRREVDQAFSEVRALPDVGATELGASEVYAS